MFVRARTRTRRLCAYLRQFEGRMVQYVGGTTKAEAFRKADKVCNAYGRVATVVSFDTVRGMAFRCVEA
jgi:hypothetical protein